MEKNKGVETTKLGGKMWTLILLFGFIGQLAWSVENMYFSKFMMNDICGNTDDRMFFNWLLIGLSAIAATSATLIGGAICDRTGKRKAFISYGYIVWGLTIMAFALVPLDFDASAFGWIVLLVVVMDCIMSFIGATANDAAFNTWLTDYTDTTNRGKVDTVLSMLPVLATVFIVIFFDKYTSPTMALDGELVTNPNYNWPLFFLLNGIVPIVVGIIGIFILKDKPGLKPVKNEDYWKEVFYGFRKDVIKENKFLYISLFGSMTAGASIQVYMGSLFTFVEYTLGIKNYIPPLGAAIVLAIIVSGIISVMMDKFGKEKFYYPIIIVGIVGCVIAACTRFALGGDTLVLRQVLLAVGAALIMSSSLLTGGLFIGSFRDYIPKGKEGSFQGIRMFIFVCIPMVIGPLLAALINKAFSGTDLALKGIVGIATEETELPLPEIFWGAAILMALTFVPAFYVKKNDRVIREKLIAERDANNETVTAEVAEEVLTPNSANDTVDNVDENNN